ncbi:MAG: hypothetical protein HYW25_03935 [Candidatus Aenigmarchaeota archaeon]|nr:hypothetical protein [Candidatus Aenigmarchaeota archaeon]
MSKLPIFFMAWGDDDGRVEVRLKESSIPRTISWLGMNEIPNLHPRDYPAVHDGSQWIYGVNNIMGFIEEREAEVKRRLPALAGSTVRIVPVGEGYDEEHLHQIAGLSLRPFANGASFQIEDPYCDVPASAFAAFADYRNPCSMSENILYELVERLSSRYETPFLAFAPVRSHRYSDTPCYGGCGIEGYGGFVYTINTRAGSHSKRVQLAKTGAHELGHVFGLDHHDPDEDVGYLGCAMCIGDVLPLNFCGECKEHLESLAR